MLVEAAFEDYMRHEQNISAEELKSAEARIRAGIDSILFEPKRKSSTIPLWLKVAASVCIIAGAGILFFLNTRYVSIVDQMQADNWGPTRNHVQLKLSDGNQLDVSAISLGQVIKGAGFKLSKTASGVLVYEADAVNANPDHLVQNTIVTPAGTNFELVLADGSHIWINAGSSVSYPSTFAGLKNREVFLTGEAYFEVAKNRAQPFKVRTSRQTLEVLGTHFNVNSYANEQIVKTTLLEGAVKITPLQHNLFAKSTVLVPGEQASLQNGNIAIQEVEVDQVLDWKSGYFRFNGEDIGSIMRKIGRWYNVETDYHTANAAQTFTGKISKSKSLTEVLNMLEESGNFRFTLEKQGQERRIVVK